MAESRSGHCSRSGVHRPSRKRAPDPTAGRRARGPSSIARATTASTPTFRSASRECHVTLGCFTNICAPVDSAPDGHRCGTACCEPGEKCLNGQCMSSCPPGHAECECTCCPPEQDVRERHVQAELVSWTRRHGPARPGTREHPAGVRELVAREAEGKLHDPGRLHRGSGCMGRVAPGPQQGVAQGVLDPVALRGMPAAHHPSRSTGSASTPGRRITRSSER